MEKKKKKETNNNKQKRERGGESELELQEKRVERMDGMDLCVRSFTRSNAGSHPCPPHN
jgi:hypothetical protein